MSAYEIRKRDGLDGSEPSGLLAVIPGGHGLNATLAVASRAGETVDVLEGDRYLVTYCGASPCWWLPGTHGGSMHQIGSHGTCHDCHKARLGYVHHLDYETELAVLAVEATADRVLSEQCEADGLTPGEYAESVAGLAVPADGDRSFAIGMHELGVNADGLAEFAVDMWDMTTWKVAVPVAEGAPRTARKLAEHLAYEATSRRCHHCNGLTGHSKRCYVTWRAEFDAEYPHLLAGSDPVPIDQNISTSTEQEN
jgi:hypothetical protein